MYMKIFLLSLLVLMTFAFTACIAPLATPTSVPATVTPVAEPTATTASSESTSYVDQLEHIVDPNLVNKTWAWEKRDPNRNQVPEIVVSAPENYTLFFNEDGTFSAQMDCNTAGGRYATSSPGSIFMELGASTMAECGSGSLAGDMANMFGPAQSYRYEEDASVLVFAWAAGGPLDTFRDATGATE